ncbi:MAG: hypothetical protein KDA73_03790 [Rhodobacteraceae bacterium]|nr:hypothetical protein [Paracoccaceae bacterium]
MSVVETAKSITSMVGDEHQEKLSKTFLGSLLGQSIALVGMLASYAAALFVLFKLFRDNMADLQKDLGPGLFWPILGAPLAVILLFVFVPMAFRAMRERRLKRIAISNEVRHPGRFRLYPYQDTDQEDFSRPDGADVSATTWLSGSDQAILYFFGASGTGKSSMLEASVLPRLRDEGHICLTLRIDRDPAAQLRDAIAETPFALPQPPHDYLTLQDMLQAVSDARVSAGEKPMIIVIDQFEEFLILNSDADRVPLLDLFEWLDATDPPGVRLLLTMRSDYRELLFKLNLPSYQSGKGAFELAPFTRREAEAFLGAGGQVLSPEGYRTLFAGLDRIEDTPGLYRPITLNMVGLVLERMGRRVQGSPDRLVQRYLRDCLASGQSRDFSKLVIGNMITSSGTKVPRNVAEIVTRTGLTEWQVKATLHEFEGEGLVRSLDPERSLWEVSHDFIARQMGLILGRLRARWFRRAAPYVLATVTALWVGALGFFLGYWPLMQESGALRQLRAAGFVRTEDAAGLDGFTANKPIGNGDLELLGRLAPQIRDPIDKLILQDQVAITDLTPISHLPIRALDLFGDAGIRDLAPLSAMPLETLSLARMSGITDLGPLAGLGKLEDLDLSHLGGEVDLRPLAGLSIRRLNLSHVDGVNDLRPIANLPLEALDLSNADGIDSLAALRRMPLTELNLSNVDRVTSLEPLRGLSIVRLDLSLADGISDLDPLRDLNRLEWLSLARASRITDLSPLRGLPLKHLDLTGLRQIADIDVLRASRDLRSLCLTDMSSVTSLDPLRWLPDLSLLDLSFNDGVSDLSPLSDTPLQRINLSNAGRIGDLSPLKRIDGLLVCGATPQQLETLFGDNPDVAVELKARCSVDMYRACD